MDAKCPKCEGLEFGIKKREDGIFCYVTCKECGSVVGVLEDVDFQKHHNRVIKNHGFFEKRINDLEEQIKEISDKNKEIFNIVDWISSKLSR